MTVAYENLVTSPEQTLRRVFEFLGESFESAVLDKFHLTERRSGIEDFKVAQTRAIHTSSIGRWACGISADEVAIAKEILGPYLGE